jgi:hypothetical protein
VDLERLREQVVIAELGQRRGVHEQLCGSDASAVPLADAQVERVVRLGLEPRRPDTEAVRDDRRQEQPAGARLEPAAVTRPRESSLRLKAVVLVCSASSSPQPAKGGERAENYDVQKYVIAYGRCR